MDIFYSEFGQYWLAFFIGIPVIGMLLGRPMRKRIQQQREKNAAAAQQLGMDYQPPSGPGSNGLIDEGAHRYSGETDSIVWNIEVLRLANQEQVAYRSSSSPSYSRWTSAIENGGNGYLLLMNLPDGVKRPSAQPGALGGMLGKLAVMALGLYVRLYFGKARADNLNLRPEHLRSLDDSAFDQRYTLFCDTPQRLARITPETRALLMEMHEQNIAVLWDGAGLALSHPTPCSTPEEVAKLADLGVSLAQTRKFNHGL